MGLREGLRVIRVLALGRHAASVAALAEECGAVPLIADVRDSAAIVAGVGDREIDILINNAGILSSRVRFQDIDHAEIDAVIDVNLKAPMHLTRALLPDMVQRKRGHLIYLGSCGAGVLPVHGGLWPLEALAEPLLR